MADALVEIAVPVPGRSVYTYRLPESLAGRAFPGSRALVPFRRSRLVGVIVRPPEPAPSGPGSGFESVLSLPDDEPALSEELIELTRWASSYYLCSWGEMLRAAVPGGRLRRKIRLEATPDGRAAASSLLPEASDVRSRLLQALAAAPPGGCDRTGLARRVGRGASAALERLLATGLTRVASEAAVAGPLAGPARPPPAPPPGSPEPPRVLDEEQAAALRAIVPAFDEPAPLPFLLYGVTGAGKTEVCLAAIAECLRRGRGAIYLVPEIGLTPRLHETLRARFGDRVAALHSGQTEAERRREWIRLQRGEASVAVGPRSAVFAPVLRPGLIVVDEEQDTAYKQQDPPRYNGRDVALVRAQRAGAVAILATATPSLESWRNAARGKYRMLRLSRRVEGRPLPRVEVVDLREEFRRTGEAAILSERLREALRQRHERKEQAVVLVNRRGWAPFLLCRSCGQTVACRRCAVSMALHATDDTLRCHWCGARRRRPPLCPACGSEHLEAVGEGTQRVERELLAALPGARIARMDSDSVRGRSASARLLAAFGRREIDVLVGTQMVAKGHDFPAVTLVGVLVTDSVLGMPDFRGAERTWQLLTQVAGRSGRGEAPGEVVVQTCRADHYAVRAAIQADAAGFYDREMAARRALRLPPFQVMAQIVARASRAERAEEAARRAREALLRSGGGRVTVLGPAPAPIPRLQGRYRFQLLARAVARRRLNAALQALVAEADSEGYLRLLAIDVDPVALL